MSDIIFINTAIYDGITESIQRSAEESSLEKLSPLPYELVKGTEITARLKDDTEALYSVMERHHKHSSVVLPKALTEIKDSFVVVDEALASSIKVSEGRT